MGPNYGKFFGHLGQSVTAQKNQWLLVFKLCIKSCICMIKVGNGPYDRSQIWDRIDARFFFEPRCSRGCFHGCLGVVCLICVLNGCLVCVRPGMAVNFGFTK